jgi:hypothetical protein
LKKKIWVYKSIYILIISLSVIAITLYLYNSNYYFNHNLLNINKFTPNERKYKTNYLNKKENNYNSILLGSSSTSYINENDFDKFIVYNYSVSAMIPSEYQYAISHLDKNNKKRVKNIFIAIEFFTTNYNEVTRLKDLNIENYILESQEHTYFIKELLNISTLKHILENILSPIEYETYYTRWENIHHAQVLNEKIVNERIIVGINKRHIRELQKYKYYSHYKDELLSLKKNNLTKQFYIFITPVAKPYMDLILRTRFKSYVKWLKETIEVFGSIYIHPYSNSITNNYLKHFTDNRHYLPSTGKEIINSMFNKKDKYDKNYNLLTKESINLYINKLAVIKKGLMNDNQ